MPTRSPARTTGSAVAADATDLFLALGSVVKRLRHSPLPGSEKGNAALGAANPAPRHVAALLQVAADGPIGMSELAERLHVSLATMSQVVTELGEWGLIERQTDAADRRRTLVSVAPEHRPLTRAILDRRLRPLERALRRLDPAEGAALLRGLAVLAEELDAAATESKAAKAIKETAR